jgi:hypothetical protein
MKETIKHILFITSILLQGCVSYSTLQTARTLGDEAASLTLAASSVNTGLKFEDGPGYRVPLVELQGIYGWNDRLDIQAKLGIVGMGSFGFKYQLLGNSTSAFALATGANMGFLSSSGDTEKTKFTDIAIPLYLSWHPRDWLAVYAAPRYTHRRERSFTLSDPAGTKYTPTTKLISRYMGASAGVRLGRKLGFMLEYSQYSNLAYAGSQGQYSAGLVFDGFSFK